MPDIERQISDSIMEPTERLLELIGLAREDGEPMRVSAGVQGGLEQGLVVVGRAPSTGSEPFTPADVRAADGRRRVIAQLRRKGRKPDAVATPLGDTARAVALSLGAVDPGDTEWAGKLGWTHLYRVAPVDGEPSPELRTLQQNLAAQLFWREILIWRPRRVVLMTGLEWAAPFVFAHHSSELRPYGQDGLVKAVGALRLQGAKIPAMVVTDPPAEGTPEERAAAIMDAFSSIGAGADPSRESGGGGFTGITLEPGNGGS